MVVTTGLIAGCADTGAAPVETERVSSEEMPAETAAQTAPVLSDEEALEIAVETYEEYLEIGGRLIDAQGKTYEELQRITTDNMRESNEELLEMAQSGKYSTAGYIPVVKSELVRNSSGSFDVLLCTDLSKSQTYDENGSPLGPSREGVTNALDVRVIYNDGEHKIDRSDSWTQSDFCGG